MKLVSKKNGTTTIFPNFISAVARKIGFTPPTGMSSTNVQDAIEEVQGEISPWISPITDNINTNTYTSSVTSVVAKTTKYGTKVHIELSLIFDNAHKVPDATPFASLPVGTEPRNQVFVPAMLDGSPNRIIINTNGTIEQWATRAIGSVYVDSWYEV